MRAPRRLFKATRSRSEERSQFGASSTGGQPRGKVVMVRSDLKKTEPRRGPIQATRSGMGAHRCVAGSSSPFLPHPLVALVPGVPPFGGVAPRHGRPSAITVPASVGSPGAIASLVDGIGGLSVSRGPAGAPVGAAAGTNRGPRRAAAGVAVPPTGPARCRRHRRGNRDTGFYPSGPRTRGWWPSGSRAAGMDHAPAGLAARGG
jgi:hypothetical protein